MLCWVVLNVYMKNVKEKLLLWIDKLLLYFLMSPLCVSHSLIQAKYPSNVCTHNTTPLTVDDNVEISIHSVLVTARSFCENVCVNEGKIASDAAVVSSFPSDLNASELWQRCGIMDGKTRTRTALLLTHT